MHALPCPFPGTRSGPQLTRRTPSARNDSARPPRVQCRTTARPSTPPPTAAAGCRRRVFRAGESHEDLVPDRYRADRAVQLAPHAVPRQARPLDHECRESGRSTEVAHRRTVGNRSRGLAPNLSLQGRQSRSTGFATLNNGSLPVRTPQSIGTRISALPRSSVNSFLFAAASSTFSSFSRKAVGGLPGKCGTSILQNGDNSTTSSTSPSQRQNCCRFGYFFAMQLCDSDLLVREVQFQLPAANFKSQHRHVFVVEVVDQHSHGVEASVDRRAGAVADPQARSPTRDQSPDAIGPQYPPAVPQRRSGKQACSNNPLLYQRCTRLQRLRDTSAQDRFEAVFAGQTLYKEGQSGPGRARTDGQGIMSPLL